MDKTISTLFNALNTNLPIPNPSDNVMPGARNFSHASIKLIAPTNPIQIKTQAMAMGNLIVLVIITFLYNRIILSDIKLKKLVFPKHHSSIQFIELIYPGNLNGYSDPVFLYFERIIRAISRQR